MILMIDNYDSFTYNVVQYLGELGAEVVVHRNDAISVDEAMALNPQAIVLSPGPCNPDKAGICLELVERAKESIPILGVCLGHQAIVESYGGDIVRANQVMHGKSSSITHCGDKMFTSMPQPMPVARYHSLMAANMPKELSILAEFEDIPMAVAHLEHKMLGFQFHPESILTSQGSQLLMQSIDYLTQAK